MFIRIDDRIINTDHITDVDLDASIYDPIHSSLGNSRYVSGVSITLTAIRGDLMDDIGSWGSKTLEYTGAQADALQSWLSKVLDCGGQVIQLPTDRKDNTG
jgi:hypothetical protein